MPMMLARRSFSVASRVRVASEQKTASVVNAVSKVVETHAKLATQKSTGILRNPNMTLTTEETARGRLATLGRRTDQARLEQMQADGSWWTGKASTPWERLVGLSQPVCLYPGYNKL